jgi:predicted nucleotidyltransferase
MTTRETEVLETAIRILQKQLNPSRIILFGSRANGRSADGSDFDLAIDAPRPVFSVEREIKDAVNESVGLYKVDIVYLPNIDPDFRALILHEGKVVYEKAA